MYIVIEVRISRICRDQEQILMHQQIICWTSLTSFLSWGKRKGSLTLSPDTIVRTGSKQRKIAPMISIFPSFGSTGRMDRNFPDRIFFKKIIKEKRSEINQLTMTTIIVYIRKNIQVKSFSKKSPETNQDLSDFRSHLVPQSFSENQWRFVPVNP